MKLINRKTRKAIDKTVRKALKKHGAALIAGLASGLASSLATLAKTEAPDKQGRSNLATVVERIEEALAPEGHDKRKARHGKKKRARQDTESIQPQAGSTGEPRPATH